MEEVTDPLMQQEIADALIKRCPYCHGCTGKIDGCNYLECTYCRAQWCWQCSKVKNFSPIPIDKQGNFEPDL